MSSELNILVEDLIENNAPDFEISKVFKTAIKEYINSIDETLDELGGKEFFVKHTKKIDSFIVLLYKYILRKNFGSYLPMGSSVPITLVALGSYGREQLCIYSDIDLMLLYEDIKGYNIKPLMEEFMTIAWDSGLKLGHRVHEISEVSEAVKEDITIKTSLLESRMIYGSKQLWFGYQNVLNQVRKTDQKEFVLEKLEEHKTRLLKYPLTMEPNIKDGYGGMREANMLFWMAKIVFGADNLKTLAGIAYTEEAYKKYRSSLEYIFQVRNALHSVAKKKLDQVNFDILPEVSSKLGFKHTKRRTKERQCMSKLLDSLHNVHWFTTIMVKKFTKHLMFEKQNITLLRKNRYKKNRYICDNKLYCSFHEKPTTLNNIIKELINLPEEVKLFDRAFIYYASKAQIPSKQNKELQKNIKALLFRKNLHAIIKFLYNARLFQSVFPLMKKIINQPQFDGYHKHPVDMHSIKTLKHVENITDSFVKHIYDELTPAEQSLVKIVGLCHDMGKGRLTDHHISGEKFFRHLGESLKLEDKTIQLGARLVRHHNAMSLVATNEDIYSQKVILNFVGLVKTELALKMLLVVTYADISAVGKNVYKSSTGTLLKELYLQALPGFDNIDLLNESSRRIKKQEAIKKSKRFKELSRLMQRKIMYISSNQLFLQLKSNQILDIALDAKDVSDFKYKIINDTNLTIQIIRQVPLNLGYLLGKLEFLNISTMNIFKLYDEKKFFEIQFSEKIDETDILYIEEVIQSSFDMNRSIKLKKPLVYENEIEIECNHTQYLAQMKVNTKDQKGLFAFIAQIFDDFGVEIESAKIYTHKNKAQDLFLIEKNGNFVVNAAAISNLLCQKTIQ